MRPEILKEAVKQFETPLYIFQKEELEETVNCFRRGFKKDIDLCFAMKANPFLTRIMSESVERVEVCSMGEFEICRALGITADKVIISGVLKKKADIFEILNHYQGECICTIESPQQRAYIEQWCQKSEKKVSVLLRLSSGNQFGMDETTLKEQIRDIQANGLLSIRGIHFFSGTQKRNVGKIRKELEKLDVFFIETEAECGLGIQELEYGPGLCVPYFEDQTDTFESDVDAMCEAVKKMQWKGKVTFEMGRALAARCGYYLTTVEDIKRTKDTNFCIVDGGAHQLNYDGQIRGMYLPHIQHLHMGEVQEAKEGETAEWTVCGSLCTVNDVVLQSFEAESLKIGDVLAFERTGAYAMTEGMSLFLSHELPDVVFHSAQGGFVQMRKRTETFPFNKEM